MDSVFLESSAFIVHRAAFIVRSFFSAVKYDIDIVLIVFVWQAVADLKSYEGYC